MSNDQRPKKMAVYSGDAPKAPAPRPADAASERGVSTSADPANEAEAAEMADAATIEAVSSSGLPIWAILLYLVAGTGAGAALVALLPHYAPHLLPAA